MPTHQPEVRSQADKPTRIAGYGAVFYDPSTEGTEYLLWEDTIERIMPGAFDRAIKEDHDVRSLFNHDPNFVLGRNRAKTLSLTVDKVGLFYEVTPPETAAGVAAIQAVARRDVSGSSFMFEPLAVAWREIREPGKPTLYVREITDLVLWEVGPVVFPAYVATTSEARNSEARAGVAPAFAEWRQKHVSTARHEFAAWRHRTVAADQARQRRARAVAVTKSARQLGRGFPSAQPARGY
jgi:HK97 family phage prohead protease